MALFSYTLLTRHEDDISVPLLLIHAEEKGGSCYGSNYGPKSNQLNVQYEVGVCYDSVYLHWNLSTIVHFVNHHQLDRLRKGSLSMGGRITLLQPTETLFLSPEAGGLFQTDYKSI